MGNIGIIGLGFMGLTHIKAYRQLPNAQIVAICDSVRLPEDGKLKAVAGNISEGEAIEFDMSVVKGYRDYEEMLRNPDVELVDICLPTPMHASVATAALRAGKHVICEKPLARTTVVCDQILEAANSANGYFMPAMCLRFWPEWVWLKDVIKNSPYGKLLSARFHRLSEPPGWSRANYFKGDESGGALLDMHIHDTDFVQFCLGQPRAVVASGQQRFSGAIDHVVTQYFVESGATVVAEGSWLMQTGFGFEMAYQVNFESATADYNSRRGAEALKLYRADQEPETITCEGPDGYVGELAHMLECIEKGQPPTVVTGEDGKNAVRICEAEEKSVATGTVVSL